MADLDIKRHEYKLILANWLRDEVNEILARYDISSDVYCADVQIDAFCIIAVDKILAAQENPPGWQPGIECEHGYDACPICDK